jgi:hypothetical protein
MRLFKRTSRRAAAVEVVPEFGVRLTLRKGDKIVRRDARGVIQVTHVTDEHVDVRHVNVAPSNR